MVPRSREWDTPQYLQQLAHIIAHLIIERRLIVNCRFNGTRINGIKVINQNIFLKKYKNENVDLILLDENIDNIAIIKKILSKNFDESKLKNLKEIIYGNIFNNEIIDLIISI